MKLSAQPLSRFTTIPPPNGAAVRSAIPKRRRSVQRHLQSAPQCAAPSSIGAAVSSAISNWRHGVQRHLLAPQRAAPSPIGAKMCGAISVVTIHSTPVTLWHDSPTSRRRSDQRHFQLAPQCEAPTRTGTTGGQCLSPPNTENN
jgi:hypothetical protein